MCQRDSKSVMQLSVCFILMNYLVSYSIICLIPPRIKGTNALLWHKQPPVTKLLPFIAPISLSTFYYIIWHSETFQEFGGNFLKCLVSIIALYPECQYFVAECFGLWLIGYLLVFFFNLSLSKITGSSLEIRQNIFREFS